MRKFLVCSAAVLSTLTMLTACGSNSGGTESKSENELVVGRIASLDGMSGDSCLGGASLQTMPMIYSSLLTFTRDGKGIQGGLASEYKYDPKRLTYTLTLDPKAAFSDGKKVTAADVVFSIDQWRTGKVSGAYYAMIKSAKAVGDDQVVIGITRPDTFLPALLTWCTSTVYPARFAGKSAEEFFKRPIGAGPYQVESWKNPGSSETLTLVKNEHYQVADQPKVAKIVFKSSTDSAQQTLAYQSGDLDMIEQIGPDDLPQIPKGQVVMTDPCVAANLFLNTKRPALKDVNVRRAISKAINREDLVSVQGGIAVPATGFLPINLPNSVSVPDAATYDLNAAKALMSKRSGSAPVKVTLGFESGSSSTSNIADLIRDQLKAIGVEATLAPSDSAKIYADAGSGKFDLLISRATAISPTVFDPIGFLVGVWYPWTGADNTQSMSEFGRGTATTDEATKNAAVRAIQQDAVDQANILGLYNVRSVFAIKPYVKDFHGWQFGMWDAPAVSINGAGE